MYMKLWIFFEDLIKHLMFMNFGKKELWQELCNRVPGVHKRIPNGILGLLCKDHYPRCIEIDGRLQPASAWEHYIQAIDRPDREGRCFASKAERVLQELWVSLVCAIIVNTSH